MLWLYTPKQTQGVKCQTILHFLSNPLNFTQWGDFSVKLETPNLEQRLLGEIPRSTLDFSQWITVWLSDSLLSLQRLSLLTIVQPLFIKIFKVKIFPYTAFHAKDTILEELETPLISLSGALCLVPLLSPLNNYFPFFCFAPFIGVFLENYICHEREALGWE